VPARIDTLVLGAGMSGLGAALSLRVPAYEGESKPGGLCYSRYVDETGTPRDPARQDVSACFRFEPAGGHWLFGMNAVRLARLAPYAEFRSYARRAAVFFPDSGRFVPYPLQEHLHGFEPALRKRILAEILADLPRPAGRAATLKDWLLLHFGETLCELFFFPFHERYTAGLYSEIGPQDAYKSPLDRERIERGARESAASAGYNAAFHYPRHGLDHLVRALSSACQIHFGHRVQRVQLNRRVVQFAHGEELAYQRLVSSIPLHHMATLCELSSPARPDPATAVLVVNIAARVGRAPPPYHWVYVPNSRSGVHRVGYYSHVDRSFLPRRYASGGEVVSVYAERSYPSGQRPGAARLALAAHAIVEELRSWGFIGEPIVVQPSFTDPAYTWAWPESTWAADTQRQLHDAGVRQIGRYGSWRFQGVVDSFEQGWATNE
jgi:protoporphyrinogen oxidase